MDKAIHQNTKMFAVLKGLLFSYIITAFMLLLLSFLMLKLDLSGSVVSGGIIFAYILSTFVGGFFVGKKAEQRKFVWIDYGSVLFCHSYVGFLSNESGRALAPW